MEHKDQKAEEKTIMEHPLGIPEMPFLHREVSAMRLQGAIAALICLFSAVQGGSRNRIYELKA